MTKKNLRQYKSSFYLIAKNILALASCTNLVRVVENKSPVFRQVA